MMNLSELLRELYKGFSRNTILVDLEKNGKLYGVPIKKVEFIPHDPLYPEAVGQYTIHIVIDKEWLDKQ